MVGKLKIIRFEDSFTYSQKLKIYELVYIYRFELEKKIEIPTEIRTRVNEFKVKSANHYTMGPSYLI